jgi:hypothetical protein
MGSNTERKSRGLRLQRRSDARPRVNPMTTDADRLARLRMDARYHRERRDLYRAKVYGPRATSPERLRELERTYDRAAERLDAVKREVAQHEATKRETAEREADHAAAGTGETSSE